MRNSWLQKMMFGAVPTVCMMLSATARATEDTEIFFNTSTNAVKPNILFVFDTSGSMNGKPADETRPKIEVIKHAMRAVIDEAPPVNIGMARFTANNGGAILYPVTDIDMAAAPIISETVLASADDAEETSAGAGKLTETVLNFDSSTANRWVAVRFPIVNVPNGAKVTGAALTFYPSLESSDLDETSSITMRVYAEASDSASEFSGATSNLNGRSRTSNYVDWTPAAWTRDKDATLNKYIGGPQSITHSAYPDLLKVVQEVVNRDNWCGGNSIVFMIERKSGTGSRKATSFDGDTSRSPQLTLQFSETASDFTTTGNPVPKCFTKSVFSRISTGTDDVEEDEGGTVTAASGDELSFSQILGEKTKNAAVGLRFQNLKMPPKSTIIDARLTVFAADKSTSNTTVEIGSHVNATGTMAGFAAGKNSVTSLNILKKQNVTFNSWALGGEYETDNIKDLIQSVVDASGWALGNSLALVIKPVSGANKHIWQQERSIATSAKLNVTYKGSYEAGTFTVRDQLKAATNGFKALGGTPIADAMMEAARYYRGETVSSLAGKRGTPATNRENSVSAKETVTAASVDHYLPSGCNLTLDPFATACKDETIKGTYKSPITDTCQSNHIVLLTDGEPNGLHSSTNTWVADASHVGTTCKTTDQGIDCTLKTVTWLNENDQATWTGMDGKQTIATHAVSFDLKAGSNAAIFMDNVAKAGGDEKAYVANNTQDIIEAFTTIINNIVSRSSTFVSAGVTVSQSNRLVHEDSLYFSMFQPGPTKRWEGNLKRYRLDDDGILVDVNDLAAVNTSSDQFVDDAQSWWSTDVDGNTVRSGGVADQLTAARKVYTNHSANSNVALYDGNNNVHEDTDEITFEMLGLPDDTKRDDTLKWARGIDVDDLDGDASTTDAHHMFGDPLHSRPALVRYKDGTGNQLRAFVGTNYGYLHSIDVASSANPNGTGQEKWSFIPKDLLKLLPELRANDALSIGSFHGPYGLDASVRVSLIDDNNDGMIDSGAGEKAYLYVGMRRGGQSYFALDVSKADEPVLKYIINEDLDSDFAGLGQTWSVPVVAKIKTGATETKRVLIFGGGYDEDQDIHDAPLADSEIEEGNAVFIADADTGKLLWSSKETELSLNAVPADVAVLDTTGDGKVDHIYAVDMRAQVFRFDIDGDGEISGHLLASLQPASPTKADNRRFYAKIDPALVRRPSGEEFIALSIGSGFREHPLETAITNHFYMLRDTSILSGDSPETIELSDLVDITDMLTYNSDGESAALAEIEDNEKDGWYLRFDKQGEKVLAESVTFDNVVYFTTYLPPSAAVTGCSANAGSARLYAVGLLDGMPAKDRDGDTKIEGSDRYQELGDRPSAGLINPQFLSTPNGFKLCVGNDCDDVSAPATLRRVKWQHLGNQ